MGDLPLPPLPFGLDWYEHLTLPEEEVAPDVLEGFGESGALVHHLVNLAPCIALCEQQGGVARGRFPAGYVFPIESGIPVIQLLLGDPQVAKLRQCCRAHQERRPEG